MRLTQKITALSKKEHGHDHRHRYQHRRRIKTSCNLAHRTVRSLRCYKIAWERLNLAVAHYVQKRPLKAPTLIEAPTVEELAIAYDVSVADIHQKLAEQ
jgi:hypothetical protein